MMLFPSWHYSSLLAVAMLLPQPAGSLGAADGRADELLPIDLRQVKVGGEIGRRIDVTVNNNLLVLDLDKDFLAPFQNKNQHGGYIGLGKLIDSAVKFAAYTGDGKVLALKQRLVERTLQAQEPDGYIGICVPADRMWGMWDVCEMGYVVWGLLSDWQYFGQTRSLEGARKAADYLVSRWPTMPKDWPQQTDVATHVAVTGLERAMLALHRQTADPRYLGFCMHERALPQWDLGIVIGRRSLIEGHVYAYMARCLAQLELYRIQPQATLLVPTRRAIDFLTGHDGLSITGAAGQLEIWTDDQDGRGELGETCATAYQLRVYDSLLRLEGDPRYGDLMERTIYNTLFAAQSPDGRRIRYYSPLEGDRVYFPRDTYCCPCNYRRIIAELPTMIYYRCGKGLAVNLYSASQATIDLDGGVRLAVRQETDYPSSGQIAIRLDPATPTKLPLRLRIPAWATTATVAVNGEPLRQPVKAGTFLNIERQWTAGDKVTLELAMAWRLVRGRQRQAGRVAVMRGPMVFCLNPVRNKRLPEQDAADLGRIALDPASFQEPAADDSLRAGGVACRVQAWKSGTSRPKKGQLELVLTEFADPDGKATYFRLRDLSAAVDDELLQRRE